jgi:hypothetical protein
LKITFTDIFIASFIVTALGVDAIFLWRGGVKNTISFRMIEWSKLYPIIPFLIGIVMGHFFWQLDLCQ